MARVIWKNPCARLHGTLCGVIYKVRYGRQHAYVPPLPGNFIARVTQRCVADIQQRKLMRTSQTPQDMQRIADEYPAIKIAVERMVLDFHPMFGDEEDKLRNAVVYWYLFNKLPPELDFCATIPSHCRE